MPIKMISKGSHTYGTRRLQAGDEFDVPGQSDARLLRALGRADLATPEPAKPVAPAVAPRKVIRKPVEKTEPKPAEAVGTPNPDPDKPVEPVDHSGLVGTVRRYTRRNLTPSQD